MKDVIMAAAVSIAVFFAGFFVATVARIPQTHHIPPPRVYLLDDESWNVSSIQYVNEEYDVVAIDCEDFSVSDEGTHIQWRVLREVP